LITAELRRAILTATGLPDADPLLRPGRVPGSYASSLPFRLARHGQDPREVAANLAARLGGEPWIEAAEATGAGYLTVTVTHDALAGLAVRVARAGPGCAASDALRGRTLPSPPPPDLAAEPGWPQAQADLTAHLTARLGATAGATSPPSGLPLTTPTPPVSPESPGPFLPTPPQPASVAAAVAYAGADAVRFALARVPPGGAAPRAAAVARHVLGNPAYAVRYAHAAAAAVLRWAAALGTRPAGPEEFRPRLLAEPGELALLDALSWLPERVAAAARRGRPDEFAGYLEGLAARTIDTMSTTSFASVSGIGSERLWLAAAARTGLAAGLDLLGISAPERL